MTEAATLECRNLCKTYHQGPDEVRVLDDVNFALWPGQSVSITGASGSGKSTFLNLLGGLDTPSTGSVLLNGHSYSDLPDKKRSKIRNSQLGFVYQFHHLLGEFTALENVALACMIGGESRKQARESSKSILERVGLLDRIAHKPSELSGGERQRVAIARALVNKPSCVLLDEPTGNLDQGNAESVQALLKELSESENTCFIVVTHDQNLARTMDLSYQLISGSLIKNND